MKALWLHAETAARLLIVLIWLLATPMTLRAQVVFDINTLPIDVENRFSNVGGFIIAVVEYDGNVVGRRSHCSGTLIHNQVLLTAGHCTGPGEFGIPPFIRLFVSFAVGALDQATWLRAVAVSTHPSLPPCPGPMGCDPTTTDVFHAGDSGIADHGLVFLSEPVLDIVPAKLAAPGFLETRKGARTP